MVETTLNGKNRIGEFLLAEKTSSETGHKTVVNESSRDENFGVFSCDKNAVYTKAEDKEWKVQWNWTMREQKSSSFNEEFVNFR